MTREKKHASISLINCITILRLRGRCAAYGVVLHPLEDGTAGEHGADDDAEPGLGEHDVGSAPGRVGGVGDSDADVRLLQRGRVVHAVAGHPADVLPLLQFLDDLVLVLCRIQDSGSITIFFEKKKDK